MIETNQMVTLTAPKGSATMKSSEKGVGTSLHKFSFSQVSIPNLFSSSSSCWTGLVSFLLSL